MATTIKFTKMQGAGNDYIYVNTLRHPIADPVRTSIKWSSCHTGIGSDGLVLIGKSTKADFSMRIFNADGSFKFWGILLGKEELAEQEFARQVERLAPLAEQAPTGKRCAFFSITANNLANVRKGGDYVAQMIGMAGGDYVFADLTDNGNNLSTMNLPLEDFYAGAKDADVLLYNSTIEGVVHTTEELVAKCPLLAEFKAVQSGSVWCTTQSFFQQSTALVDFVLDLHRVFTENDPADLQFLRKVE